VRAAVAGAAALIVAGSFAVATAATAAAPAPAPTPVAVTVVIPGATPTPSNTSGTGNGGGGGGGGGGGSSPTPTPTPAPTTAPVPPPNPGEPAEGLTLDHERISAGEWMIAIGTGFRAGEKVQLVVYSDPLVVGSFVSDDSGRFEARFRIPDDLRLGEHTAEATGWISGHVANERFTVISDSAAAAGDLPIWWWIVFVIVALAIGIASTLFAFRRSLRRWAGGPLAEGAAT